MRLLRALPFVLALLLALATAHAAVIRGTVYSIEFSKARNAVVEINTQPRQAVITANGTYAITVPLGDYTLAARQLQQGVTVAEATEFLAVRAEGEYVLDLILFPDVDENQTDLLGDVEDINPEEALDRTTPAVILLWLLGSLALAFGWAGWQRLRPRKHEPPATKTEKSPTAQPFAAAKEAADDAGAILAFIKEQGGRTTQKDIRRKFPLSEAKVSLVIAELEHKGRVEKIKKGRGNIIILK
jgi:uncharacterized membrane protein